MNNVIALSTVFSDHPLTVLTIHDKPALIAREVGEAIGYTEGRSFVNRIRGEWASEFIEGTDFMVLTGEALDLLRLDTQSVPSRAPAVLVLFESGWNLALLKTRKPAGAALRRHLAQTVLPEIRKTGAYVPRHAQVTANDDKMRLAQDREARLGRMQKARGLRRAVKTLGRLGVGDDVLATLEIEAASVEAGRELAGLLPETPAVWASPTQIAEQLGVTTARIGRTISALGIRAEKDGFSKKVLNTAKGSHKTVVSWFYAPEAVAMIRDHLVEHGYIS